MNQIKQTTLLAMLLLLSACVALTTDAPATIIPPSPTLPVIGTVGPDGILIEGATATPELVDPLPEATSAPEQLTPNSFNCWTESVADGCLGLVEKPGMNIAEKIQTAWFTGPSYEEFWKDTLGVETKPTEEQVRAWVEANGWHIPLKSPSGIDFPWLQAESANAKGKLFAKFAPLDNPTAQELGYIDLSQGVRFMSFDPDTWAADAGGVRTEFERLMAMNGTSWPIFAGNSLKSAVEIGGPIVDEGGRVVVVVGSTRRSDYFAQKGFGQYFLGGEGAVSEEIVSAWMEVLVRAIGTMGNNDEFYGRASDGKCQKFTLDPENRTGSCMKVPGYFRGDNSWFEQAGEEAANLDDETLLALYNFFTAQGFAQRVRDQQLV